MRFLVVMDPVSTIVWDEDTSFALMLEAERRGHQVWHCLLRDLELHDQQLLAHARQARTRRDARRPVELGPPQRQPVERFDVVLIRKDPPFDPNYLWATLLLEHARGRTLLVNDPRGLREANEKLYALRFPELVPETLVSADEEAIAAFVTRVGGTAVLKPLDGYGGGGVFVLREGDLNLRSLVQAATRDGVRPVMVQRYLPEVRRGDKRILLLDGEPVAAVLRIPREDDVRSNLHVGGRATKAQLDERDRRIVDRIAPALRADGLRFVGIDVIGGYLTEVNVTSPTGLQHASRLLGRPVERDVVDWLERAARQVQGSADVS